MEQGRVTGTELMPSLVGGSTETICGKLKNRNRFLKPNFEPEPSPRQFDTPIGCLIRIINLIVPFCITGSLSPSGVSYPFLVHSIGEVYDQQAIYGRIQNRSGKASHRPRLLSRRGRGTTGNDHLCQERSAQPGSVQATYKQANVQVIGFYSKSIEHGPFAPLSFITC
jgi:hypothetical protein